MDVTKMIVRLEALLAAFFIEARREQQQRGLEKRGSENKPAAQTPHAFDRMIDVICADLGLKNPGTDGHSMNIHPHPIDGWSSEASEHMRRARVMLLMEKGKPEDVDWLRTEGFGLTKSGWARKLATFDHLNDE